MLHGLGLPGFRSWVIFHVYNVIHFVLWSPVDRHQHCLHTFALTALLRTHMLMSLRPAPFKFGGWIVAELPDHTVILFYALFVCLFEETPHWFPLHQLHFFYPHQQWKFIFEWYFTMKTGQQELLRDFRGIFCHSGWQLVSGIEDKCRGVSCTKLNWIQHWDLGTGDMNALFNNLLPLETM